MLGSIFFDYKSSNFRAVSGLAASSLPCRIDGVILSTTLRRGDEGRPFVEEH